MSNRKAAIAACAVVLSLAACGDTSAQTTPLAEQPPAVSSPAPLGDELTPSATVLKFGEPARMMDSANTGGTEKTKMEIVPVSVKHGSISDFQGINLDDAELSKEYFYITMSITNLGPLPMDSVTMLWVQASDTAHDDMTKLDIIGDFPPCDYAVAEGLAVGATYTACQVYVAPEGQDVDEVAYVVPNGLDEEFWVAWPPR